ncbi:unnamed protein product [Prorocentrum cordatum]|uniref:Uncharacterized protein n=1 Tax=Prorocentrum cordatum TaxID=2364126 RepID=A0ABN9UA01_9DINO|nr:unnamed protein product [Polarella glacialis]
MLFDGEAAFDLDPYLFQLSNCVVDLRSNTIRPGRPTDMTSLRSPIRVPQRWLQNSDLVESESASDRQRSWSILRSLYKREGDHHPDDCAEELGDADAENFQHMMHLQARLLEGTPLCKCALLWSRRGRNGKGICEKIFQAAWGEYYVPVRATVFTADKRSEHEHKAADAFRRGFRVAFGNEVHSAAWSNAVFKSRNSTDPITARACNSGETEKMKPMCTYIFACNDIPSWEQVPKGSERDRLLPMYMPNKFRDSFDAPTSPRSFLKDHGLEAEIGRPEFAIGHLLNLLTIRSSASSGGGLSLHELAATGTKTTAHWLEAWMTEWSRVDGDGAHEGEVNGESFALVQDIHARLYASRTRALLQCQVDQTRCDLPLAAPKTKRWAVLLGHVRAQGRLGANLAQIGAAKSRKQRMQACVTALPFDTSLYNQFFSDTATFGDLAEYTYNLSLDAFAPAEDALAKPAEAEVPTRMCRYTVCEAANLTALRARRDAGAAVTGERRQEGLSAHVDLLNEAGQACTMKDGFLRPTSEPGCPDIRVLRREYYQLDEIGRAHALRPHVPDGAIERDFGIVKMYADKSKEWRSDVAQYYNIDVPQAKAIFSRLPFKGSIQPDASWEGDRSDDMLPCLMELRSAFRRGQETLAAECDNYKKARSWNSTLPLACPTARGFRFRCFPAASPAAAARAASDARTSRNRKAASMEKVLQKAHPGSSALALYLQTKEDEILESMAAAAKGLQACVLSLVFDGMYVAMPSMPDIAGLFDSVAGHVWETHGVRIALKAAGGETIKAFAAASKRSRSSDEDEAETAQKKAKVCHLTQDMEKLLDIDASAAASGAHQGGGPPCAQEEQRGHGQGGGMLGAAAASGAPEGSGQLIAQEEQFGCEPGGGPPDTQEPSMAGRWNEGDAVVSEAAHGGA